MLDLSNTMVEDADIAQLMGQCHNLQTLKLAGCRKLMSVGAALLQPESGSFTLLCASHSRAMSRASHMTSLSDQPALCFASCSCVHAFLSKHLKPSAGARMETLSLQRCFQIRDDALAELLEAAATTKPQLHCIALSHLLLLHWPKAVQPSAACSDSDHELASSHDRSTSHAVDISPVPTSLMGGSGLQALALHNCQGIAPQGLQTIAAACPQLRMLFLGGSSFQVPKQSRASSAAGSGFTPMLNRIPRSRAATIAGVLKKAPSCYHPSARPIASELAQVIFQLPQLLLVEITFLPYGVRSELRSLVDSQCSSPVQVLDLCEAKSITACRGICSSNSASSRNADSHDDGMASRLTLLLEAAANCSNAVRQTPLHVAVDVDDANAVEVMLCLTAVASCHLQSCVLTIIKCSQAESCVALLLCLSLHNGMAISLQMAPQQQKMHCNICTTGLAAQGLLQLGSGVNSRDKGAATPLFVACESGHTACAKLLLHAGADVLLRNSAGEAPLYIAALRGEILVVNALLRHMQQEGIPWQVPLQLVLYCCAHQIAYGSCTLAWC